MPELVRDYRVQAMVDGNWRDLAVVRDNRRRLPLRGLSRGPSWPSTPHDLAHNVRPGRRTAGLASRWERCAMLSDDDRRTLRELERQLGAEDAAFVQRFDAAGRRPRPATVFAWPQIAGALALGLLMLLAGSMAGALAFTLAAATVGLAWWYADEPDADRRDRPTPERQD